MKPKLERRKTFKRFGDRSVKMLGDPLTSKGEALGIPAPHLKLNSEGEVPGFNMTTGRILHVNPKLGVEEEDVGLESDLPVGKPRGHKGGLLLWWSHLSHC